MSNVLFSIPSLPTLAAMAEARQALYAVANAGEVTSLVAHRCVQGWIEAFALMEGNGTFIPDPEIAYESAIDAIGVYISELEEKGLDTTLFRREALRQIARLDCLCEKYRKSVT